MKIAVIGAGMIGSAAARHLAEAGQDVTLIGPGEPASPDHAGPFASHHDAGRITRVIDADPFWSRAAHDSIARYGDIAARSGIAFHTPVGLVTTAPHGTADAVTLAGAAAPLGLPPLDPCAVAARFPFLRLAPDAVAYHEPAPAGHINPRALVAAQIRLALAAGARHVTQPVTALQDSADGVHVICGDRHRFDRVLVAAGGWTDGLLPTPLGLTVYGRTIALMRLDAAEAVRLAAMPALIWHEADGFGPYLLPPIRYPDGQHWLKIGGDTVDLRLPDSAAINTWFRGGGNPDVAAMLVDWTRRHLPGLAIAETRSGACVVTYSADDRPVLRRLSDRLVVAAAGCGRAAKSSDELGRLGALLAGDADLPDWATAP